MLARALHGGRLYPTGVPPGLSRGDPSRFAALKARLSSGRYRDE
ncbi:MAG TPA: hypothetical protein VGS98_14150 [Thermoanaerobaculia bacterium]|nr:hypothetical protein [Thermoanaerobaculia bacterium]